MKNKRTRINLDVSPQLAISLKQYAEKVDMPVNGLLRLIIAEYLSARGYNG